MKKAWLLLLTQFICSIGFSQISFEKGYFIDNDNNRIDCFIKNLDWKNNPTSFDYKLEGSTIVNSASIESLKEFGINNESRFIRFNTQIDRSDDGINKIGSSSVPLFTEETMFLEVIVEGYAYLYKYVEGSVIRYFIQKDSSVEQLIYKKYLVGSELKENNQFKQQLWNLLKCTSITKSKIEGLQYKQKQLEKIFWEFNTCKDSSYQIPSEKSKGKAVNFYLRPGLKFATLQLDNKLTSNVDFDINAGFRIGLEAELILPFNNNKWILFTEPTYQYYKKEGEYTYVKTPNFSLSTPLLVDYKSMELPIGLRYYSFLNKSSKLFINGGIILDFPISSSITAPERKDLVDLEIKTNYSLALGVGYCYLNKYSIECRYNFNRPLLGNNNVWSTKYTYFSFNFGVKLF